MVRSWELEASPGFPGTRGEIMEVDEKRRKVREKADQLRDELEFNCARKAVGLGQ